MPLVAPGSKPGANPTKSTQETPQIQSRKGLRMVSPGIHSWARGVRVPLRGEGFERDMEIMSDPGPEIIIFHPSPALMTAILGWVGITHESLDGL